MPPSSSLRAPSGARSVDRQSYHHRPPQHPQQHQPPKKVKKRPPRTTHKKWAASSANHANDERSRYSAASSCSVSHHTPTSVALDGTTILTRDLSDLSGSYMNGNTMSGMRSTSAASSAGAAGSTGAAVPKNVYPADQSTTSYQRPWRQAQVLSVREPVHPQPPRDCDDSMGFSRSKSKVMVGPHGIVEVVRVNNPISVDDDDDSTNLSDSTGYNHREPLLILLMDPGRKVYELMQLWIDVSSDTVRDVLHAVQLSLADKWRQDYDGLFHVRNNNFTQLIHILGVNKYEVQPLELWVAKPWAMSAKATISYANSLVHHLKNMDILTYLSTSDTATNSKRKNLFATRSQKADDLILGLSTKAQKRVYAPEGVMKHHHAVQFLTFFPSFEPNMRVDVLADSTSTDSDDAASQLSESLVVNSMGDDKEEQSSSLLDISPSVRRQQTRSSSVVSPVTLASASAAASASQAPSSAASSNNLKNVKVSKAAQESLQDEPSSKSFSASRKSSGNPHRTSTSSAAVPQPIELNKMQTSSSEPRGGGGGGMGRLFSALNCSKRTARRDTADMDSIPEGDALQLTESRNSDSGTGTLLAKVWEDESFASQSITSDSRPLLQVRSTTSTTKCSWDSQAAF